jgi:hypothetical protein
MGEKMTLEEKRRVFDIKCRSKRGLPVTKAESRFCEKMFQLHQDEYGDDEKEVFLATKPFGA